MNADMAMTGDGIREAQEVDDDLKIKRSHCGSGAYSDFQIDTEGCLWYKNWICVPKKPKLIRMICDEAHSSRLSIHPGSTKIRKDKYSELGKYYWKNSVDYDDTLRKNPPRLHLLSNTEPDDVFT
ncbi:integrase [Gossypium australe]|uniref:Integrase n=1 Tax=Gossypium australe TaxID=47621 RepID=A0A5B6WXW4_9ROSI|nr:integrase [Gossypium australe]